MFSKRAQRVIAADDPPSSSGVLGFIDGSRDRYLLVQLDQGATDYGSFMVAIPGVGLLVPASTPQATASGAQVTLAYNGAGQRDAAATLDPELTLGTRGSGQAVAISFRLTASLNPNAHTGSAQVVYDGQTYDFTFAVPARDAEMVLAQIVQAIQQENAELLYPLADRRHAYAAPGVYTVALTVTDRAGATASATAESYAVVYDPDGGFVTGGGWIAAPASACQRAALCGGASGKANFGLNARYHNGASMPVGNSEYKVENFQFKATGYSWLVVTGATARYQGTATINGAGGYAFQLTVIDGQAAGGGGTSRFGLRVWEAASGAVVYDTQPGATDGAAPTTPLGGGSIVIH